MDLETAQQEARTYLQRFIGVGEAVRTTSFLNELEDVINGLIWTWARDHNFRVHDDGFGSPKKSLRLIKGVKIWYDDFDGSLRFAFRY